MKIIKKTKTGVLLSYRKGGTTELIPWKEFEEKFTVTEGFFVDYKRPTLGDQSLALTALAKSMKKSERGRR